MLSCSNKELPWSSVEFVSFFSRHFSLNCFAQVYKRCSFVLEKPVEIRFSIALLGPKHGINVKVVDREDLKT